MKVIYGIGQYDLKIKNTVLVIGVFDGMHLGHQALIKQAIVRAKKIKGRVVVMTFYPHPVHVLHPEVDLPYIVSLNYRLKLIEKMGVAATLVVRFTKRFASQSPEGFIKQYLFQRIKPLEVFVGDDFRFGQNRTGTIDLFHQAGEKYGFHLNAVTAIQGKSAKISSTQIRESIREGNLKGACKYLGRHISFMGQVVKGDKRGTGLGYPTANLIPNNDVLPPHGVYAVRILIGSKKYKGMANIGFRPTFHSRTKQINVEVHIFNFKKNIYSEFIIVEFIKHIRSEKIFPTKEELVTQIQNDAIQSKKVLKSFS